MSKRPSLMAIPGMVPPEEAAPSPEAASTLRVVPQGEAPPRWTPPAQPAADVRANRSPVSEGRVQLGIRVEPAVRERLADICHNRGRIRMQQLFDEMIDRLLRETYPSEGSK